MCCANSEKQWITSARRRGPSGDAGETDSEAGYSNGNSAARYGAHPPRTQLYEALTADLKEPRHSSRSFEIEDLFHAIERLYEELKQ